MNLSLAAVDDARRRRGRAEIRGMTTAQHLLPFGGAPAAEKPAFPCTRGSGGRDLKIDRRFRAIVLTNNALRNLLAGGATGRRVEARIGGGGEIVVVARRRCVAALRGAAARASLAGDCDPALDAYTRRRYSFSFLFSASSAIASAPITMAANDLKQTLRKLDFPYCAREALGRIGIRL